jgi:hypothetical protein
MFLTGLLSATFAAYGQTEKYPNVRSKLVGYLKDVNSPLVKGIEERTLIR